MRLHHVASAALLSLAIAAPAAAQASPAALPFAGCWAPADGLSARNRICVTPTAAAMLEFTSITADGKITESTLSLDGRRIAVKSDDCEGWEEGRLTSDGERLVVRAEITCGNEPRQIRATAFTITPSGHLMQVSGTGLAVIANTQVRLYVPVETYADIPPATRELLMPYLIAAERERLDVRENVVSAKDLAEFERLEVAPALIDVLVAASYPKSFVIDGVGTVADAGPLQGQVAQRPVSSQFMYMNGYPMLSMYDWQMMYECARIGIGCPMGAYGYSRYGYGGYGLGGWGGGWGGYGGYWPGNGGIVVVRPVTPTPGSGSPGGRAVRGRGYTQSGTSGGTTASPRSSAGISNNGSSVESSGGSSSSGASSSGSGSSDRTAKPRSP